jgi:AcrR family transcriptional regulator
MEAAVHLNSSEFDTIPNATLSPAQAHVIAALAQGRTITDAARDAGIHRTTIHHWFRTEPIFETAVQEAQREYVETLQDGMRDLAARAVETLRNLLDDPKTPPAVRLRTALAILQRPHFPAQGWHLPERIETPREQQVVDTLAEIKADYDVMRMTEAMQAHNPSVSEGASASEPIAHGASAPIVHSPSVSAGASSSQPIARSAPCPCGSGNKYKRCCGSASAGKFTPPVGQRPASKAPGVAA